MIFFSKREIKQLFNSLVFITFIFIIASKDYVFLNMIYNFIIYFIVLFFSFILHELAHKIVAQKLGFQAEYFSNDKYSFISILFAFFGFILISPGAIHVKGYIQKKESALISMAGPIINIIIAIISYIYINVTLFNFNIFRISFLINSILAIFNLIPVNPFDGKKIYDSNKTIFVILMLIAFILNML